MIKPGHLTVDEQKWVGGVEALMAKDKLPPERYAVAAPAFLIIERLCDEMTKLRAQNEALLKVAAAAEECEMHLFREANVRRLGDLRSALASCTSRGILRPR